MFECEYFAVNHSIPDALAIAVYTGAGTVLHTGDIKLDQLPLDGRPTDLPGMSRLGDAGVDLFLCDSTNAEHPGVGPSESEVGPTLHRLIRGADGRVIVACFASNVDRVQQIIDAAVALGRRVSFVGRSMVRNMGIARDLGFLRVDDSDLIDIARRRDDGARTGGADHHRHPGRADGGVVADVARRASQHHADRARPGDPVVVADPRQRGSGLRRHRLAGQDRRPRRHQCPSAGACFGPRLRRRAAVPVQRGAAAQRDAGARHLADAARQRQAGRQHRGAAGVNCVGRERRQRRPGGRQGSRSPARCRSARCSSTG